MQKPDETYVRTYMHALTHTCPLTYLLTYNFFFNQCGLEQCKPSRIIKIKCIVREVVTVLYRVNPEFLIAKKNIPKNV